jgi:large subunit ribosomal protein L30
VPKKSGTIHIKWVRSGIGFSRKQKEVVRSIGLGRLNQVVERPDTVHFRGLVAKVSHLVEVVEPSVAPAWAGVPEYKILPAEVAPKKVVPPAKKVVKEAPAEAPAATKEKEKAVAPRKKTVAAKAGTAKSSAKAASAATEKPKAKRKPAAPKSAATAKKESKPKKGKK